MNRFLVLFFLIASSAAAQGVLLSKPIAFLTRPIPCAMFFFCFLLAWMSLILRRFFWSYPSAILWCIVSIVVNTIYPRANRFCAHISKEIFKFIPTLTDLNATASIAMKTSKAGDGATHSHVSPCLPFTRRFTSVFCMAMSRNPAIVTFQEALRFAKKIAAPTSFRCFRVFSAPALANHKYKLAYALCFCLLFSSVGFSQGIRFSSTVTQQGTIGTITNAVILPAAPQIAFCNHPANAVPCTNKATTYQDQTLAVACSTSTQIVRDGTNTCVASPDAQNNWGVWVPPNTLGYDYTITLAGGVNLGPFNVLSQTTTVTGNFTATAGQNSINFGASNNIIYLDGTTYPRTCAGINSAIAAAPHGTGSNLTPNASPAGARIILGYGDISCNVTVLIDRPITLEGSGEAGRLVVGTGLVGSQVMHVTKNANSVINQYGQAIGVRLQNLWVEDTAFRSQNTDCLWVEGNDEVMLDKFECKWLKGYGLQLDNNGTNATPVRESNFYNFVSWGCGDPAQSKASLMLITNSAPGGSDEINEIRFKGGGVKAEWWEAVHIDTGQPAASQKQGPRLIFFDNFQIEARATLDNSSPLVPAIAPNSNNVHIVKGNSIFFHGGSMSNAGQGKSALQVDGTLAAPVLMVSLDDMNIGGNPSLTGNVSCTNVANSVCIWQSGNQFQPVQNVDWAGLTISIPAAACTTSCVILSQQSATQITLTTNTGAITNQPYTISSGGWGASTSYLTGLTAKCVNWIGNPLGNLNPTIANTNSYNYVELPCSNTTMQTAGDAFDFIGLGSDYAVGFQNNTASTGQRWVLDSLANGQFSITPKTTAKNLNLNLGGNTVVSLPSVLEQACPGGAVGYEIGCGDSTLHALKWSYSNGPFLIGPRVTAVGTPGNAVKLAANGFDLTDAGAPPAGFTSVNVTPASGNANVTTDQNGMFVTVTAGALNSVSRTILIQVAGVYSTPAASTAVLTHKLKLCTVSGCGSGTVITLATWATSALGGIQATNNPYNMTLNSSTQTAGATAAFEVHGNLTIDLAALAAAAEAVFADNNTATVGTIDSTAQLFLQHTVAFSAASASNSFTDRQMIADTVD